MTTRTSFLFAFVLQALFRTPTAAQGPRGAGIDARTPGPGALSIVVGASWMRSPEEYRDGVLRELGAKFTIDSLGTGTFQSLASVQADARIASGLPGFEASLGALRTHARRSFETTPVTVEYGIGKRAAVSVMVPFVTSAVRVDAQVNSLRTEANIGVNPAIGTPSLIANNASLLSQLDAATAYVNARVASCSANPAGAGCAAFNANAAGARTLADASKAYAAAIGTLYGGRNGATGALFVPLAGSAAQAAVAARLSGLKAQFAAFGAPGISATAPIGSAAPLTTGAFQSVLTDSSYGVMANPLGSVVRRGVGDIEVGGMLTVHDSYARATASGHWKARLWWRGAIGATVRLGTGALSDPAELIPVGTGDGQQDIELRSITDVGIGTRASVSLAVRYTQQASAEATLRIPDAAGDPFPEAFRTLTTTRSLGDEYAAELFPRWTASEALAIAGYYGVRRKGTDMLTGTASAADASGEIRALNAAVLTESGASTEHRFGAGMAYSTVAAWQRGQARWPIEVSITHYQTTRGSGSLVPKLAFDAVQLRWYWRPFGGRAGK
ncbi:MAG: hypothetical protein P3A28_04410 [Gemmatimonadota bacterium]|nr:hypothetical protein [Gemmatimonadota bacterium]